MPARTSIEIGNTVSDPVKHAVIFGDALYSEGIANALSSSGLAGSIDKLATDDKSQDRILDDAELVILCPDGNGTERDAVIRRILRRNRHARIVLITDAPWEERLDYISEKRIGACLSTSIARDQLVAALHLVIDGFSII